MLNVYYPYLGDIHRPDGRKGMVVCNYSETEAVTVRPRLLNGAALTRSRLVDEDALSPFAGSLTLPPESAAVFI